MTDFSITQIFSDRRREQEFEKNRRLEEVYQEIPEIKDLNDEIQKIGFSTFQKIMNGKSELKHSANEEIERLIARKKELLEAGGFPPDYIDLHYYCDKCKDRGYLENGERCECYTRAMIENNVEKSSLKTLLLKQNFDTFDLSLFSDKPYGGEKSSPRENMEYNLKIAKSFVDIRDEEFYNLFFYGKTGTGKTFMSSAIAKVFLEKGHTVVYQTVFDIIRIAGDENFRNLNKDKFESFFNCDLLIIDDLGSETANTFTNSALFEIINFRMAHNKKIIISSNLNIDKGEIQERYSERIFSRLRYFIRLKFYGEDLRRKV